MGGIVKNIIILKIVIQDNRRVPFRVVTLKKKKLKILQLALKKRVPLNGSEDIVGALCIGFKRCVSVKSSGLRYIRITNVMKCQQKNLLPPPSVILINKWNLLQLSLAKSKPPN